METKERQQFLLECKWPAKCGICKSIVPAGDHFLLFEPTETEHWNFQCLDRDKHNKVAEELWERGSVS